MVLFVNIILIIFILIFFIEISKEIQNRCRKHLLYILMIGLLIINLMAICEV